MFDAGPFEFFLLILVGVIVLGPERLPAVARTFGRWVRRGRKMAGEFQRELEREVDLQEVKKLQKEIADAAKPVTDGIGKTLDESHSILDKEKDRIENLMTPGSTDLGSDGSDSQSAPSSGQETTSLLPGVDSNRT